MRTADLIMRWCDLYTRGLSPAVAGDRRDELASDLWEHAAAEPRATGAMLSRAIRGVPADLAWRYEQRRTARRMVPMRFRVLGGGVAALTAVAASALIGLGLFVLARHVAFSPQRFSESETWVLGLTFMAIAGSLLLLRVKTRSLGALALALGTALIPFAHRELSTFSVTARQLNQTAEWELALWCLVACVASMFIAAALLWLPARRERA
jgi:hypothetical protein